MDDEYIMAGRLAADLLRRPRRERGLTQVDVADEMSRAFAGLSRRWRELRTSRDISPSLSPTP